MNGDLYHLTTRFGSTVAAGLWGLSQTRVANLVSYNAYKGSAAIFAADVLGQIILGKLFYKFDAEKSIDYGTASPAERTVYRFISNAMSTGAVWFVVQRIGWIATANLPLISAVCWGSAFLTFTPAVCKIVIENVGALK